MTLKLSEICATALRIAVIRGEISNASDWPVVLRRSMLEWFRIKRQLHHEKVVQLLCQPGFFDGFTAINMHEGDLDEWKNLSFVPVVEDDSDGRSLASAVRIFTTVQNLADNITDLCLGVACITDDYPEKEDDSSRTELAYLLGLCKNLKRLKLVGNGRPNLGLLSDLHNFSETADVSFPALEHLSLISFSGNWTGTQVPRRLFEPLQSLQVHSINCDQEIYSDILACCQNTLTCLDVVDDERDYTILSPVPIRLPKLSTLSFTRYGLEGAQIKFDDIIEHCPNLTAATLRISDEMVSETDLATLADLSKRVRLSIELRACLRNVSKFVEAVGECILALSLDDDTGYNGRDCDNILSNIPNLRYLDTNYAITFPDTVLFENHFADRVRAERLIELYSCITLSSTILKCLFTNCFKLRYLYLELESYSEDISNYLQTWVENGARPAYVDCQTLIPLEPQTVCSLLKASGRELNRLFLTVRLTEEKIDEMILNVLRNHCPFLQDCHITFRVSSESESHGRVLFVNGSFARTCSKAYMI